jgi:hypothetical protein
MTQEEAQPRIVAEWEAWLKREGRIHPTGTDGLIFFSYLQREKSYLLDFKFSGDKRQCIKSWIRVA